MWNLSCRKTRRLLALSAGNDLDERELAQAHRHLAACPHCRIVWQRLKQSQQVLERASAAPAESERLPSVWPAVARQVRAIDEEPVRADWRGWLPAGALAAACLAIVLIALPAGPDAEKGGSPSVIFTQPVDSMPRRRLMRDPREIQRLPLEIPRDPAANPRDRGPAADDRSF